MTQVEAAGIPNRVYLFLKMDRPLDLRRQHWFISECSSDVGAAVLAVNQASSGPLTDFMENRCQRSPDCLPKLNENGHKAISA